MTGVHLLNCTVFNFYFTTNYSPAELKSAGELADGLEFRIAGFKVSGSGFKVIGHYSLVIGKTTAYCLLPTADGFRVRGSVVQSSQFGVFQHRTITDPQVLFCCSKFLFDVCFQFFKSHILSFSTDFSLMSLIISASNCFSFLFVSIIYGLNVTGNWTLVIGIGSGHWEEDCRLLTAYCCRVHGSWFRVLSLGMRGDSLPRKKSPYCLLLLDFYVELC